jgi:DNA-binding GntR family transcriptional regulator
MAGDYRPGEPMRESSLARRLEVSRPTVREALQQLVREGLLTHQLHRGMVVTSLSEDDIVDIYHLRSVLESAGVAMLKSGRRTLDGAERSVAMFVDAVSANDALASVDADMAFHNALVAFTGSERLTQTHLDAVGQLRLALGRMDLASDDAKRQVMEHRRLLRNLKARQVDAALSHLHAHLELACTQLIAFVRQNDER